MNYSSLVRPFLVGTISLFLLGNAQSSNTNNDYVIKPTLQDVVQSAQEGKSCKKILPPTLESYCNLTWGTKWDLTTSYFRFIANNEKYKELFESLEDLLGYKNGLLSGVGYAESRFRQSDKSWADAYGVMQITEIGYQGLLSRYSTAKSLIEKYIDKDSLEDVMLNIPETLNKISLKGNPSFDEIQEIFPETAKFLVKIYNIRSDRESRMYLDNPENWSDETVKKPSPEELEVIIKQVFVPLYKAIIFSEEKYFDNEMPSFENIIEDARTNIVIGALIYDSGKKELSILSHTLDDNNVTHFNWKSPEIHKENETSAIQPDDLDFMAFGPYNAGLGATIWRLQIMYDKLNFEGPLRAEKALKRGAFYWQTRVGMRGIKDWSSRYDYLDTINKRFNLEERERLTDDE